MKRSNLLRKINKNSLASKAFKKIKAESANTIKKRLQALLRELAIKRDVTCVLAKYPEAGKCGRLRNDGELILQAEHLNTRARNISFADMRNIVLLCVNHHFYFKKQHSLLYWSLIQKEIGEERWNWLQRVIMDTKIYAMDRHDWLKLEIALNQELQNYEK